MAGLRPLYGCLSFGLSEFVSDGLPAMGASRYEIHQAGRAAFGIF